MCGYFASSREKFLRALEANCAHCSSLDPALKDFLDRVIIPALVREFTKTLLASSGGAKAQSSQQARQED